MAIPALAAILASPLAFADSQPKVCVAVAGDADQGVRRAALALADAIDARAELRGVADVDARAALRGEPAPSTPSTPSQSWSALATTRRALTGADGDASTLDTIGNQFGCALVIEVASHPVDIELRAYDVVHHAFRGRTSVTSVDATLIDRFVLPAAHDALAAPPPTTTAATEPVADNAPPASTHQGPLPPPAPASEPAAAHGDDAAPATHAAAPSSGGHGPGYAAWGIAGGLALLLIVGFIVAQSSTSDTPVISVSHAGR